MAFSTANIYCSTECRNNFISIKRKNIRENKFKETPKKPCAKCEKLFRPKTVNGKFCSDKCMQRYKYEANPFNRETFGTGTTLNRGRKQSPEHIKKRAESVARSLMKIIRKCVKCHEDFTPTLAAQKYCSGRCWQSVSRAKREKRHTINIHADHYKVLFDLQNGRCKICESESGSNGRGDKLAVDHCHISGHIRGLLCHKCNTALGLFQDSEKTYKPGLIT